MGGETEETHVAARNGGSHSPKLPNLIGAVNVPRIPRFVPSKSEQTCWGSQKIPYKYLRPLIIIAFYCHLFLCILFAFSEKALVFHSCFAYTPTNLLSFLHIRQRILSFTQHQIHYYFLQQSSKWPHLNDQQKAKVSARLFHLPVTLTQMMHL